MFDLQPKDMDEQTLKLIYANYESPDEEEVIKAANVASILDVLAK